MDHLSQIIFKFDFNSIKGQTPKFHKLAHSKPMISQYFVHGPKKSKKLWTQWNINFSYHYQLIQQ